MLIRNHYTNHNPFFTYNYLSDTKSNLLNNSFFKIRLTAKFNYNKKFYVNKLYDAFTKSHLLSDIRK